MNAPLPSTTARAARQAEVLAALQPLLPAHALLWRSEDTVPYECDGLTAYREQPLLVALPETEAQVAALLRACHALKVPVVARGAGTGLSGGALPHPLGVRCRWPVQQDPEARQVLAHGSRAMRRAQPGHQRGGGAGSAVHAPTRAARIACSIGGNVAELRRRALP